MAPKQPCAKYQYVLTAQGPKILPVPDAHSRDEESPADYNQGGYLQVKVRDTFKDSRYTVVRKLGWGHFSTVWLVKDNHKNCHSALKVVKSAGRYTETARDEIKLLRQVMAANTSHSGRNHIVSFLDSFTHSPLHQPSPAYGSISQSSATSPDVHICIVFEPLGENLLALVERHKATGVPVSLVKIITKQLLLGLQYLHEECELVHTDIKPENIMISIPDVEGHIQAQLSTSPPPASRKVAVPPKTATRVGVTIPKRNLSVNTTLLKQTRQVHIFDSQPLASPSSSTSWSSKGLLQGLTRVKEVDSAHRSAHASAVSSPLGFKPKSVDAVDTDQDLRAKQESGDSDSSDVSSGPSSMAISCNVMTSSETPASSVGSLVGAFDRLMSNRKGKETATRVAEGQGKTGVSQMEMEIQEATCTCIFDSDAEHGSAGGKVGGNEGCEPGLHKSRVNPPSGPSLLSRTAPPDLHRHRPHCSTHSKSPTEIPAPLADGKLSPPALPPSPPIASPSASSSSKSSSSSATPLASMRGPPISIKIADLGNATPIRRHYTEDIQTRQYRAPEAITGRNDWDDSTDIWSVACVVFELLTAEYLFDPQNQGELFGKDDDHCAQIIELLGSWPESVRWGGRYSREIFDSNGNLRYIRNLKHWPLRRVMVEKYGWKEGDSAALCEFLLPMLDIDHHTRAHARDLIDHPWLEVDLEKDIVQAEGW